MPEDFCVTGNSLSQASRSINLRPQAAPHCWKIKMSFAGKEQILKITELVDGLCARFIRFRLNAAQPGRVTTFVFHRFFHEGELQNDRVGVFPHEQITLAHVDRFLELCRAAGFRFILPSEIPYCSVSGYKAVILTVDDGYADTIRLLPVLERHDAKAVVCVCAANILNATRFWPDALYIGARRTGMTACQRGRLRRKLAAQPYVETKRILIGQFGESIFEPEHLIDRPMTPHELRQLSQSPRIEIGCHSFDHTILAPRSPEFVADQLNLSIRIVGEIIGYRPTIIAYPNGVYSGELMNLCRHLGFRTGFTLKPRNNSVLDWSSDAALGLGRFTLSGHRNLERQITSTQMPYSLTRALYGMKNCRAE
jgi:peptidoglycan/xylan/chitin deacetylase (PgdA/CDA1 family)